jgi:hypothetical protein
MSIRVFKFGIIATILQLILYWILFRSIQITSLLITNGESEFISDWAFVSIGIFGIMLFIQNILTVISNRKKVNMVSAYIVSFLIILAWCEDLGHKPYQTISCMLVSVITVFSKFYIDKILAKYLIEEKPNA